MIYMGLSLHTCFNYCRSSTCLLICLAHSVRLSVDHGLNKFWKSGCQANILMTRKRCISILWFLSTDCS